MRAQCKHSSRTFHSRICPAFPEPVQPRASPWLCGCVSLPPHLWSCPREASGNLAAALRGLQAPAGLLQYSTHAPQRIAPSVQPSLHSLTQVRPQLNLPEALPTALRALGSPALHRALIFYEGCQQAEAGPEAFLEQVHECRDNGYLLSLQKIGSGAFSKVYLAYATQERMRHSCKLASDLRGKCHTMVRQGSPLP